MTLTRPRLSAFVLIPMAAAIVVAAIVPGNAEFVQQGADQGFTYGYLPTLVLHHDLDFSRAALPFDSSMPHTVTGRSHNAFPMGPSIWWTPAFVGAYGATAAVNAIRPGHPIANDGRSRAYDMLVGLASMALAIVGLWAVLRITRRFAPPVPATLATIGIWLAGPLVYYANEAPLQSHVAGFTSSALLVLLWLRYRDRTDMTLSRVALLGILGGFVALSRWQDLVILIGPGVDVLIGRLRRRRGPDLPGAAAFGLGVVVGVLPQLAVWNGLYGSPFRPPRGEAAGGFLNLARLEVSGVLFSWWHGLFSWHPLLGLAVVGLVLGLRHHRMVCGSLLAALAVMVLVNAGVLDWWAGAAFGGRRFDGLWPGLAIGLAIIFAKMPRVLAIALTAAAAGWNWLLLCAFTGGTIPTNAAVTPAALVRAVPKT
ncbi:MAG: hypothetical protein QOG64_2098, partial [Acidimicrobiaceae bacterium]|nr:hypothetical protein [Acidimicrobiaceae bacterium]